MTTIYIAPDEIARPERSPFSIVTMVAIVVLMSVSAFAQAPPPAYPPSELEHLVSRIALYPDPLLAQILAASTYPDQVPDAATWADEHHYLSGEALATAIADDRLPWDPAVQALLPFPSVLEMMASDMAWTTELGDAFLVQRQELMDAAQRLRQQARDYGYLQSNPQIVVSGGPYIEIVPASPDYLVVPFYDPLVVFTPPHLGIRIGDAIRFGFGINIGTAFRPWGWGGNRIVWNAHTVIINNTPWDRVWGNRIGYVHPYSVPRYAVPRPPERHPAIVRSPRERDAARSGHPRVEEHRHGR